MFRDRTRFMVSLGAKLRLESNEVSVEVFLKRRQWSLFEWSDAI